MEYTVTVAPRVGAWIETVIIRPLIAKYDVAPRVGAWIETLMTAVALYLIRSRPSCRGVD